MVYKSTNEEIMISVAEIYRLHGITIGSFED